MKAEQLKEYITKMIRAEIRNVIREEVKICLTEAFGDRKSPTTNSTNHEELKSSFKNLMESESVGSEPQKKSQKAVQYTKNPILNAVLNETAQSFKGVPQEGSMVGMMGNFSSGGSELINETVSQPVNIAPEIPASAPVEVKKTAAVFNRDFRSLMKAVDKKVAAKKM